MHHCTGFWRSNWTHNHHCSRRRAGVVLGGSRLLSTPHTFRNSPRLNVTVVPHTRPSGSPHEPSLGLTDLASPSLCPSRGRVLKQFGRRSRGGAVSRVERGDARTQRPRPLISVFRSGKSIRPGPHRRRATRGDPEHGRTLRSRRCARVAPDCGRGGRFASRAERHQQRHWGTQRR